ncbi:MULTISPECIES: hypothetical protein [unclassified Shimia]|uniref:hypothetical protein n=1 Tax=unclassified Shimia TaxID=2630038 RepID=UPI001ADBED81|nr:MULTISPECIES: hypothetical protein [unclassified Shimia]MBO9475659.1 hypothetical protein [Shimia sp. R10_1]MDA5559077.1 hypothetical protein [Shimia sp. MMG029]
MAMPIAKALCATITSAALLATSPTAGIAEQQSSAGIAIELSAADEVGGACLMSFLATNSYPEDIKHAVYEVVLFNTSGGVERLTLLDFQDLPSARPRVRQFRFDEISCENIPRVLINGVDTCVAGDNVSCLNGITLSTRVRTELIG